MHEGGGRWVGSNKLVELKKKKNGCTEVFNFDEIQFIYFSFFSYFRCSEALFYDRVLISIKGKLDLFQKITFTVKSRAMQIQI